MRITYNAPVILTFAIAASVVLTLDYLTNGMLIKTYFMSPTNIGSLNDAARLWSYIIGHSNWDHLAGNFLIILLVGPIVEEKYGSARTVFMIFLTAVITALINIFIVPGTTIIGASGIAFMFITLASLVNMAKGKIPLTFIAVFTLYFVKEIYAVIFIKDTISHFGHLMGGICGGVFGFFFKASDT